MTRLRWTLGLCALCVAASAAAQDEPTPADPPAAAQAEPAVEDAPEVEEAQQLEIKAANCPIYLIMPMGTTCYWCFQDCVLLTTLQGYGSCSLPLSHCMNGNCVSNTSFQPQQAEPRRPIRWLRNPNTNSVRNRFEPQVPGEHKRKRNYQLVDSRLYRVMWMNEAGEPQTSRVQALELQVTSTVEMIPAFRCWPAFAVEFASPQQQNEFDGLAKAVDGTYRNIDGVDFIDFEDDFTPNGMNDPVQFRAVLTPDLP